MVEQPVTADVEQASPELQLALEHYRRRLPVINVAVAERLQNSGMTQSRLADANGVISMDIAAALSLGDMAYLGQEIAWLEGLMQNHGFPVALLNQYIRTYVAVLDAHLGDQGQPIIAYLEQLVS